MSRRVYDAEQRALAFRVWREVGRNAAEALRRLEAEYGWPLSRQTLFSWMGEDGWGARADGLDAEDARRERAEQVDRTAMLAALELQRLRYEEYFAMCAAKDAVDPKATSAYAALVRVILSVKDQLDAGAGLDPLAIAGDVLADLSDYVRDQAPEHAEALAAVLAPFAERLAERYG